MLAIPKNLSRNLSNFSKKTIFKVFKITKNVKPLKTLKQMLLVGYLTYSIVRKRDNLEA